MFKRIQTRTTPTDDPKLMAVLAFIFGDTFVREVIKELNVLGVDVESVPLGTLMAHKDYSLPITIATRIAREMGEI